MAQKTLVKSTLYCKAIKYTHFHYSHTFGFLAWNPGWYVVASGSHPQTQKLSSDLICSKMKSIVQNGFYFLLLVRVAWPTVRRAKSHCPDTGGFSCRQCSTRGMSSQSELTIRNQKCWPSRKTIFLGCEEWVTLVTKYKALFARKETVTLNKTGNYF